MPVAPPTWAVQAMPGPSREPYNRGMSTSTIYRSTARDLTGPVRESLGRRQYLVLATRNPDGYAHAVPVVHLFHDGCFLVATSSTSRKARNIAARPDVTVTVDDRTEQAWVSPVGTADLLHGQRSLAAAGVPLDEPEGWFPS